MIRSGGTMVDLERALVLGWTNVLRRATNGQSSRGFWTEFRRIARSGRTGRSRPNCIGYWMLTYATTRVESGGFMRPPSKNTVRQSALNLGECSSGRQGVARERASTATNDDLVQPRVGTGMIWSAWPGFRDRK